MTFESASGQFVYKPAVPGAEDIAIAVNCQRPIVLAAARVDPGPVDRGQNKRCIGSRFDLKEIAVTRTAARAPEHRRAEKVP